MRIDAKTADRLKKVCRLFGSDKLGERASAALMAHNLLKAIGLDWDDVIAPRAIGRPANDDIGNPLDYALRRVHLLDPWQRKFVFSLKGWHGRLTPKQRAKLSEITSELRSRRAA